MIKVEVFNMCVFFLGKFLNLGLLFYIVFGTIGFLQVIFQLNLVHLFDIMLGIVFLKVIFEQILGLLF